MSKGISSDLSSDDEIHRKLFIGALNPATTDDNLRKYFSKFGKLVDWIVVRCSETNRSRKFGFVTYSRLVFLLNQTCLTFAKKKMETIKIFI